MILNSNIKKDRVLRIPGFFIVLGLVCMFFTVSCNEDPEPFGGDVIPSDDIFDVHRDSSNIYAYTAIRDSFGIGNPDFLNLGYYNDPIFGESTYGFITQFFPLDFAHSFGDNPIADSLVLTLERRSFIGDVEKELEVQIFEVLDTFDRAIKYYSTFDHSLYVGSSPIQTTNIKFVNNKAKIKLPKSLADHFVAEGDTVIHSYSNFISHFKGLYLKVIDGVDEGQVNQIFVDDNNLTLYYKNSTDDLEEDENLDYKYFTGRSVVRFNIVDNDYSNTEMQNHFNDTINQDTVIYVQGIGGPLGYLNLRDAFSKWKKLVIDSSYVINKAELICKISDEYPHSGLTTDTLVLKYYEDSTYVNIADNKVNSMYAGGIYSYADGDYKFRVTRHLSNIISDREEYKDLYIFNKNYYDIPKRVILNSGNNSDPIKLYITYTKIK